MGKPGNLEPRQQPSPELHEDKRGDLGGQGDHRPISVGGETEEVIQSFKFLEVHISQDLSWATNTSSVSKRSAQRLCFLRMQIKSQLMQKLMIHFYTSTIDFLTHCTTCLHHYPRTCSIHFIHSLSNNYILVHILS